MSRPSSSRRNNGMLANALSATVGFSLISVALAQYRGEMPCRNDHRISGDTSSSSNLRYNPSPDHYYDIYLGVGVYTFNSCGSSYDTWLRVIPGRFRDNGGYATCADRNNFQGNNCASCDDCGSCSISQVQTILNVRITNPGYYTLLIEGYSSRNGIYTLLFTAADPNSCSREPTNTPSTSSPTHVPSSSHPTEVPTARPTSSSPTRLPSSSPTKRPTTSAPTEVPSVMPTSSSPTIAPTTDPCLIHQCSKDCVGIARRTGKECGWSFSRNLCLTVDGVTSFSTTRLTQDRLFHTDNNPFACARYWTDEPTAAPTRSPVSTSASSGDDTAAISSTVLIAVAVGGACLIFLILAVCCIMMCNVRKSQENTRSPTVVAFENPQYASFVAAAAAYQAQATQPAQSIYDTPDMLEDTTAGDGYLDVDAEDDSEEDYDSE